MIYPFPPSNPDTRNFEARYDRIPPSERFAEQVSWRNDRLEIVQNMHERIYVCDVCTRCGKTVERSKP